MATVGVKGLTVTGLVLALGEQFVLFVVLHKMGFWCPTPFGGADPLKSSSGSVWSVHQIC